MYSTGTTTTLLNLAAAMNSAFKGRAAPFESAGDVFSPSVCVRMHSWRNSRANRASTQSRLQSFKNPQSEKGSNLQPIHLRTRQGPQPTQLRRQGPSIQSVRQKLDQSLAVSRETIDSLVKGKSLRSRMPHGETIELGETGNYGLLKRSGNSYEPPKATEAWKDVYVFSNPPLAQYGGKTQMLLRRAEIVHLLEYLGTDGAKEVRLCRKNTRDKNNAEIQGGDGRIIKFVAGDEELSRMAKLAADGNFSDLADQLNEPRCIGTVEEVVKGAIGGAVEKLKKKQESVWVWRKAGHVCVVSDESLTQYGYTKSKFDCPDMRRALQTLELSHIPMEAVTFRQLADNHLIGGNWSRYMWAITPDGRGRLAYDEGGTLWKADGVTYRFDPVLVSVGEDTYLASRGSWIRPALAASREDVMVYRPALAYPGEAAPSAITQWTEYVTKILDGEDDEALPISPDLKVTDLPARC